jgi:hypothetical protein
MKSINLDATNEYTSSLIDPWSDEKKSPSLYHAIQNNKTTKKNITWTPLSELRGFA